MVTSVVERPRLSWRSKLSLSIIVLGFLMFAGGLVWMLVTGVGVPFPDPTPEQAIYEKHHVKISTGLLLWGMYIANVGLMMTFITFIFWWKNRRRLEQAEQSIAST